MATAQAVSAVRSSNAGLIESFRSLWKRRETIRYLTVSTLKAGHRDKVLGHFWNLLDPLLFVGVYFVVFGLLFGQALGRAGRGTDFILYLSSGVLVLRFFDATVAQAAMCVRGNRGLIHEISFPKAVFPVSVCISRLYDFLWGLLVLAVIILLVRGTLTVHALWAVPLVALLVCFLGGLAFLVAYLGAFYADTSNVLSVVMRLMMYGSPTFYYVRGEQSILPERYLPIYMLNPLACFYESFRDALVYARTPEAGMFLYVAGVSVAVLLIGFVVFSRGEGKFAKYV
jgi:ABC-type polysaccharide/polyol phosphate export permease